MRKLKLFFVTCALVLGAMSMQAKTDITSTYLKDADLSSLTGWGNPGKTDWKTDGAVNVVEFWNWSSQFVFEQEVTLPAGYYRLAVNAFYRESWSGNGTNNDMAWIFAAKDDESVNFNQNVVALTGMSELSGYAGSNDLYRAATAFSQGKYSNEFDFDLTEETTLKIGFKGTCPNGGWCILGPVTLWEYTAEDYMDDYRAKVTIAEGLYDTPMWAADLANLKAAVVEESTLTTVDGVKSAITTLTNAINAANSSIISYANAIAPFNKLKAAADAIAAVEYTETTAGSHDTFIAAIATQQTAATNAADAAAIEDAITALKDAVKAYVNAAEPKNDGEYFDVTILMANPDFDDNNKNGWTTEKGGNGYLNENTRIQCNEFYGTASFNFYQTVTGLPNGSYTLSMRAFQRPGGYDAVYADWANNINKATAKVYVNNDESDVKNIMAEMNDEIIYNEGEAAFNTDKKPNGASGYIPNSMEGAAAWFAADKYQSTAAALVEDGTLKLGFKDGEHIGNDTWTLFDEFRLRYYGSSKMIYYKQQLPAIKAAANEDFSNALYTNVTGKEKTDFEAAIAATPAEETEAAYKTIIDDIYAKQTIFRESYPTYDNLAAAKAEAKLEKITANVGTGVFQYDATTNNSLYTAYETAYNTMMATSAVYPDNPSATADNINAALTLYNARKAAYQNQALNAPDAEKRYWVTMHDAGQAWDGFAITFEEGGRTDEGNYAVKYLVAANANYNQALKFTHVEGNKYKISGIRVADGTEQYLTGKLKGYSDGNNDQIRTIDDASKALEITVQATTTDNQFKLINETGTEIARNNETPDNGVYAAGDVSSYFTIQEASQASVTIDIPVAQQYATAIFPFAPSLPSGVKAYSCAEISDKTLTLVEVGTPAANVPYILENVTDPSADVNETLQGWGTAYADNYTIGLLTGTYTTIAAPNGSYILQKQGEEVAFYQVDTDVATPNVPANHAYLEVPSTARALYFDAATAIKTIEALTSGEAEIYGANGARQNGLKKGVNIIKRGDKTMKVMVK